MLKNGYGKVRLLCGMLIFGACLAMTATVSAAATVPVQREAGEAVSGDTAMRRSESADSLLSVVVHFRWNSSILTRDYMENAAALDRLHRILGSDGAAANIGGIRIAGAASPEGTTAYNNELALRRAVAVRTHITGRYPHLDADMILASSAGENWDGLRDMVAGDSSMPYRTEVLDALDNMQTADAKRTRLKAIGGGAAYRYIVANMLPRLREATTIIIYFREEPPVTELPAEVIVVDETPGTEVVVIETPEGEVVVIEKPGGEIFDGAPTRWETVRKPLFAVKTNLLFDLATALNVEVEVPIGKRWSVAGEYMFPWWLCESKQRAAQIITGTLEARYWFGDREDRPQMTGWFAGLYGGGGYYDIEWGDNGCQGELFHVGLSAGYAHSISKNNNWRMEYSIGVGYLNSDYREYVPKWGLDEEWHLVRQRNGDLDWFGPTRAKVSLVWMINGKSRMKGGAQ